MSRLLRSGLRFGWALSTAGASAVARRLAGEPEALERAARDAARALHVERVETERDEPRAWPSVESWLGAGPSRDAWLDAERRLVVGAGEILAGARVVLPASASRLTVLGWEQKLAAYGLFRRAATLSPDEPLARRIERVESAPVAERLWLLEGLGYDHAERFDEAAVALPTFQTGVGLSSGRRRLDDPDADDEEVARVTLADGGTIRVETLGFATRLLAPARLAAIERALVRAAVEGPIDPTSARALFWHGVGRASWFSRDPATPSSLRRRARSSADVELAAANAVAGLAWAVAMVHVLAPAPAPEILEASLRSWDLLPVDRIAVADGVASASLLWLDGVGETAAYRALAAPRGRLWRELVSGPVERARADASTLAESPDSLYCFAARGGTP